MRWSKSKDKKSSLLLSYAALALIGSPGASHEQLPATSLFPSYNERASFPTAWEGAGEEPAIRDHWKPPSPLAPHPVVLVVYRILNASVIDVKAFPYFLVRQAVKFPVHSVRTLSRLNSQPRPQPRASRAEL